MLQTTSQKIIAVLGVLMILMLLGYFMFNNAQIPTAPADLSGQPIKGQDILDLANQVDTISIDQSVFSSNVFKSLVDYEIPLGAELQGRPNPFAKIGLDAFGSTQVATKTAVKLSN